MNTNAHPSRAPGARIFNPQHAALVRVSKRPIALAVAALALLLGLAQASALSLQVGTVRGFPGNTVVVPVTLRYGTNEPRNVVAFQADVLFQAVGLSDGTPVGGPILVRHLLASSAPAAGTRRLLAYSAQNDFLTNGVVATIPFTVAPKEYRNFTLTLTNVVLARADGSQVFGTNVNGFIGVSQVFVAPDGHADGFLNVPTNTGPEACWVVQSSSDLITWANLSTNSAGGSLLEFRDPQAATYPQKFYRAILCEALTGVHLGSITLLPDGRMRFDFPATAGLQYILQASTNLTQWENIRTNTGAGAVIQFSEPASAYPNRFFRVQPVK